jgi:hypothetical protein
MAAPVIGASTQTSSPVANEWFINTKFAVKPNVEQRASTVALADDSDLVLHVDASKTYHCRLFASIGAPVTPGFRFSFGVPAGCTLYGPARSSIGDAGLIVHWSAIYDGVNQFAGDNIALPATFGSGSSDFVELDAILVTAGTAGNFRFRWAQKVSDPANTSVRAGSWMLLRRVS